MAETVTDKDVAQSRRKVDGLREKIAEARIEESANISDQENAVSKARLDTEAERLEAELAAIKARSTKTAIRESTDAVIDQIHGVAIDEVVPLSTENEEK